MRGKSAIKLTDVCFSYDGEEPQLNNLSLEIDKGECVLVTGASGCGKTTLTRLINGLIPHYYEGELTGDLQLNGKSTSTLADWEYGEQVGSVFQDARSQFFTSNVLDELAFASENYRLEAETITQRIDQVLELNRMDYLRNRKLSQLSSGEKQKVAMGAVEVHHPEIFVLDEPSANLDNQGNAQLAATVEQLKRTGKTVVIADHRIHYLMETADRIVYMAKGEIKVQWTIEEFRQLSEAQLHSYDIRERREIALAELLRAETAVKEPFLSLKDLAIGYHRLAPSLIKNLNIELSKGEIVLFTGGNGLGKTTLARTLCGLNKEQAGAISIEGQLQSAKKRRRKCWFVLQDADYQLFSDSVLNELLLGMKKTEENQAKAEKLLKELNLWTFKEQHPATLSGGQKQRLVFAVGLMREPELLILDEPTSGLDAGNMRRVQRMIVDYADKGITFVIITHDFEFAKGFGQRTIELSQHGAQSTQQPDLALLK